jgi:hypothetical protein
LIQRHSSRLKDLASQVVPTTFAIAPQDQTALYRYYDRLARPSLEPLQYRRACA